MSWGLLGGLGQGMQQVGGTMQANAQDQIKEQRVKEWQQKMRAEDRQFQMEDYGRQREDQLADYGMQRQDKMSDYEMQRGHAIEDRDFAAQHATKLAGMRSSGTGTERLDPRISIIDKELTGITKMLEFEMDETKRSELMQQYSALVEQRRQLGGLPGLGGGNATDWRTQGIVDVEDDETETTPPPSKVDPISTIMQFNQNSGGLLNNPQDYDWQAMNAEHAQKKDQIKSVRLALEKGYPLMLEEYQDVYHLLGPHEQARLDAMQKPKGSGIAQEMFPQLR